MITVLLTCEACGLIDAEVKVEARPEDMDVRHWFEAVLKPTLSHYHSTHSLLCEATEMTGVKLPMSNDPRAWIGKQTDVVPPKGPINSKGKA